MIDGRSLTDISNILEKIKIMYIEYTVHNRYSIKCHSIGIIFLIMNENESKDKTESMNKTMVEHNYGIW